VVPRRAATPQSQVARNPRWRPWTWRAAAGRPARPGRWAAPSQRIVYFDFDSFVIKDDYKA
jgi:outer membrane protein OmpA-like peptidoglycan-associated protein